MRACSLKAHGNHAARARGRRLVLDLCPADAERLRSLSRTLRRSPESAALDLLHSGLAVLADDGVLERSAP